jgi:hypothetical protein
MFLIIYYNELLTKFIKDIYLTRMRIKYKRELNSRDYLEQFV